MSKWWEADFAWHQFLWDRRCLLGSYCYEQQAMQVKVEKPKPERWNEMKWNETIANANNQTPQIRRNNPNRLCTRGQYSSKGRQSLPKGITEKDKIFKKRNWPVRNPIEGRRREEWRQREREKWENAGMIEERKEWVKVRVYI